MQNSKCWDNTNCSFYDNNFVFFFFKLSHLVSIYPYFSLNILITTTTTTETTEKNNCEWKEMEIAKIMVAFEGIYVAPARTF